LKDCVSSPSKTSAFWLLSAVGSEAAVCVPAAAAVIEALLIVVIAPSTSDPAAPQNQA
jgi:hypothetical protein